METDKAATLLPATYELVIEDRVVNMPRAHSDWLTATIATAERFDYEGWHVPSADVFGEIFTWLRG
jgi:hypothetical protein